jgi:hypothetical protein
LTVRLYTMCCCAIVGSIVVILLFFSLFDLASFSII